MKCITRHIILIFCILWGTSLYAQNDIGISNYMFDEISYNPSFTGEGETFRASLLARKQWLGMVGSPLFQTLSVDGKTKNIGGLGLHVVNDKIGFENQITATVNYSYGVNIGKKSRLTLGFAGGFINRAIDEDEFVFQNQTVSDPEIGTENSYMIPTLNVGLNLMIHEVVTIGVSSTHVTNNSLIINNMPRHFYGYAQCRINQNGKVMIVPTALMKYGSDMVQIEANTNFYLFNTCWLGASYRSKEAVVALAGIILKNRIFIGYSYDYNIGDKSRYSSGCHEIFLSWRMRKDPRQKGFYQSTRLFN